MEDILKKFPFIVSIKRYIWRRFIVPWSKPSFLMGLNEEVTLLDVGCGNNSPYSTKQILPKCHYTGLDIVDYNQSQPILADSYIVTTAENFCGELRRFRDAFDVVISTHNIEHCNDREGVLDAMLDAVRPGGYLYLSFPCEASVNFPKRSGTLNYYDDDTHKGTPPSYDGFIKRIKEKGFSIEYSARQYKPFFYWMVGWLREWRSRRTNRTYPSTWAYYGFESLIVARKSGAD